MTSAAARLPFPATDVTVVTDAGLETWLIFERDIELAAFAAYPLAGTASGRALLAEYYEHYLSIAEQAGAAVELEAATWRASPGWAAALGQDRPTLARLIESSVDVVHELRSRWTGSQPFLVGGAVGPRSDGYRLDAAMDADEAADYHSFQIDCLAGTPVDLVTAMTLAYADEAIGISRAAAAAGLPVVISFTVETDGRLASGSSLAEAIEATDAATGGYPLHYMINCAHPSHFAHVLDGSAGWAGRIGGVRANASTLSHAELDVLEGIDPGDPDDLARRYVALRSALPGLHVVGGCCGTDHRHVEAITTAFGADRR
jgi:homocysteine S-methyltransferase